MVTSPPRDAPAALGLPSIRVQSVLYNLVLENVERSLIYLDNAARNAQEKGAVGHVSVAYGDCSPTRTLSPEELDQFRRRFNHLSGVEYTFFDANLGHGGGQNRLFEDVTADYVLILNPDVLAAPNLFEELLGAICRPQVGLVDARQLPAEHPKEYDEQTGETSWGSGACALLSAQLFRELGGFDAETFFMYCDDVDLSWRVRLAGYKVVHESSALVVHDKRLDHDGRWMAGGAEQYYSAEAGLLLPYKYSRPDLTEMYLEAFRRTDESALLKAVAAFVLRQKNGTLPVPIDPDHAVGEFVEGAYGRHRFQTR